MLDINEIIKSNEKEISNIIIESLVNQEIKIKHPTRNTVTYLRQSKQIPNTNRLANVLFFSDENRENQWFAVQAISFIDSYIVDNEVINPFNHRWLSDVHRKILGKEVEFDYKSNNKKLDGLIFSQTRPYHFFYDQFVNYFKLSAISNINDYCFKNQHCFYEDLPNQETLKKSKDDGCYIYPCIKPNKYESKDADLMHEFILYNSHTPHDHIDDIYDLKLWIGITSEKRSWVEQVDGYSSLIKELKKSHAKIIVYIDGMTNFIDDNSISYDDVDVYEKIKSRTSCDDIKVINLVNKKYVDKVSIAKNCDYFICNNGTGGIVPHMFCGLSGVLHGDPRLSTFRKSYHKNLKIVPDNKQICDISTFAARASYSFHWSVVFNLLMDLMGKDIKIKEKRTKPISKFIFANIKPSNDITESLTSIAAAFEQCGDVNTAFSLMQKALEQKPKDLAIIDKLALYSNELKRES